MSVFWLANERREYYICASINHPSLLFFSLALTTFDHSHIIIGGDVFFLLSDGTNFLVNSLFVPHPESYLVRVVSRVDGYI